MSQAVLYVMHALSPVHVGVDQGLGAIDLPMMRAIHTGDPLIPGSSIKGVLRDCAERAKFSDVEAAFGPPQERAGDFQGGLVFSDAHVVALPVRSLCGGFAWLTCPRVLKRLKRDLKDATGKELELPQTQKLTPEGGLRATDSALAVPGSAEDVFLEELLLRSSTDPAVDQLADTLGAWFWGDDKASVDDLRRRLLIVHDDVYGFFCRVGLEVRARVKIDDDTGTAAKSGPWTEEHLPAETLLAGFAYGRATAVKTEKKRGEPGTPRNAADGIASLKAILGNGMILRFGGHATIGLGRARIRLGGA